MLSLRGEPFTTGVARFYDSRTLRVRAEALVYVRIEVEGLASPILAMLDTGAAWSILEAELAGAVGIDLKDGEPKRLSTRLARRRRGRRRPTCAATSVRHGFL